MPVSRAPAWTTEQIGLVRKKLGAGESLDAIVQALGGQFSKDLIDHRARRLGMARLGRRAHSGTSKFSIRGEKTGAAVDQA